MTRDHDDVARRPERVIILDADEPMTEIQGQFVWQEEHERVVEATRCQAYDQGYRDAINSQPQVPSRRSWAMRIRLAVLLLLALFFLLMLPIIFG